MKLNKLFQQASYPAIDIFDIMYDSREIKENSIFFCLRGIENDGHQFINQAIDHGACCIVHSRDLANKKEGIIYIQINDLENHFPKLVARFFENSDEKLNIIGVTGTNGKTTTASLIYQLTSKQHKSAYSGTLGVYYDDPPINLHNLEVMGLTTNDLVSNYRNFQTFVKNDVKLVAMEVSSQGLDLNRVSDIHFDTAIFTNLSQDHLDYHLDMESYYQAKCKLFNQIPKTQPVVINIDDDYGKRLAKQLENPIITVSNQDKQAVAYYCDITFKDMTTSFSLIFDQKTYHCQTNLVGSYNICNYVEALMSLVVLGYSLDDLLIWGKDFKQIAGRNQLFKLANGVLAVVDFAHTPSSMEAIMHYYQQQLSENGRLVAVFGAPGKRDKSKRAKMGQVADSYCAAIYLTEDDPRNEQVSAISEEIAQGIYSHPYIKIDDRKEAIYQAITTATASDIVLILGKGSETIMARQLDQKYPGDIEIVKQIEKKIKENYEKN